jgi:ribonuclease P/MRP protein subunit RPP1
MSWQAIKGRILSKDNLWLGSDLGNIFLSIMYFDLNVHVPGSGRPTEVSQSKKGKGKQPQQSSSATYSAAQITVIEARIDLLVHCQWVSLPVSMIWNYVWCSLTAVGYTVIAFSQTVQKKVDPKTHVNVLDPLLAQLRKRAGVVVLKRLTVILDDESEKGTGLVSIILQNERRPA